MVPGDRAEALPLCTFQTDRFPVKADRSAADGTAFEPGSPHAGLDPLDDERALELRDGADDDDDGPAQRATCVDLLAERDELDLEMIQVIEDRPDASAR